MKEIKVIFFRLIFNIPLGFFLFKILGDINPRFCLNLLDMELIFGELAIRLLPDTFWGFIYLSILFFAGEVVATLGEWLINWVFRFPAFWRMGKIGSRGIFEKIAPLGWKYIRTKKFVQALNANGAAADFSEMHFALSRLLAGAAWLCLLLFFSSSGWLAALIFVFVLIAIKKKKGDGSILFAEGNASNAHWCAWPGYHQLHLCE